MMKMAEVSVSINSRIAILALWATYAKQNGYADDVVGIVSTTSPMFNLYGGMNGARPPSGWGAALSTGIGFGSAIFQDPLARGIAILGVMGIAPEGSDLVQFNANLLSQSVLRARDGQLVYTPLSSWEKVALIVQRYGGIDPRNIVDFLRKTVVVEANLTPQERQILDAMGVDPSKVFSASQDVVDNIVKSYELPDNLKPFVQGSGSYIRIDGSPVPPCFLAGTPISVGAGVSVPIEQILPGDMVSSFMGGVDFDGRVALSAPIESGRVKRLFGGITQEIIEIKYSFENEDYTIYATPRHVMLTASGQFISSPCSDVGRRICSC